MIHFIYGINFDMKYKNFDFNMFWQGIVGNDVKNDWKSYSDFGLFGHNKDLIIPPDY